VYVAYVVDITRTDAGDQIKHYGVHSALAEQGPAFSIAKSLELLIMAVNRECKVLTREEYEEEAGNADDEYSEDEYVILV
jgi:hypothetical protein